MSKRKQSVETTVCVQLRNVVTSLVESKNPEANTKKNKKSKADTNPLQLFHLLLQLRNDISRLDGVNDKENERVKQEIEKSEAKYSELMTLLETKKLLEQEVNTQRALFKDVFSSPEIAQVKEATNTTVFDDKNKERDNTQAHAQNTHKEIFSVLNSDLAQRLSLEKETKMLEQKKKLLIDTQSQSVKNLQLLETTLKEFAVSGLSQFKEYFTITNTSKAHPSSQYLTEPLFVIFKECSVYIHNLSEGFKPKIDLDIRGNLEEVINPPEESTPPSKPNLSTRFPLSVQVTISHHDHTTQLIFYQYTTLKLITVDIISNKNNQLFLDTVFPNDDGNECPNPSTHFLVDDNLFLPNDPKYNLLGKPFKWAQCLAGTLKHPHVFQQSKYSLQEIMDIVLEKL